MKFISAHHTIEEFVSELESLIQNGTYRADNLLIVTLEEHASDLKSLVAVEIETVSEDALKDDKPLNKHGLDDQSVELYDDILRRGGYVLLETIDNKDEKQTDNKDEVGLHAPGFGVTPEKPQSDETNHEDNFNPDNPNPSAHR